MWFGFLATHDDIILWNSSKSWDRFVYLPYMRIGLLFSFNLLKNAQNYLSGWGARVTRNATLFEMLLIQQVH